MVEGGAEFLAGDGDQVQAVAVRLHGVQGGVVERARGQIGAQRVGVGHGELRAPAAGGGELRIGDEVGQRGLPVGVHGAADRLVGGADDLAGLGRRGGLCLADEFLGPGVGLDIQVDRLVERRGLRADHVSGGGVDGEVDDRDRPAVGRRRHDDPLVVLRVEDAARGRAPGGADDEGVDGRVEVLDQFEVGEGLGARAGVEVAVGRIGLDQGDDRLDAEEPQRLDGLIDRPERVRQAGRGLGDGLGRRGDRHDPHPDVADAVDGERERRGRVVRRDHVGGQEREGRTAEGRQGRVDPTVLLREATRLDQ